MTHFQGSFEEQTVQTFLTAVSQEIPKNRDPVEANKLI